MNFRRILPVDRGDESIYVFARPYFLAFLPWFIIGASLIILGVLFIFLVIFGFPDILREPLGYNIFVVMTSAYFLLIIPFMTVAFIDFYYDLHIVTDRRLIDIDQNQLFSREVNELALEEVQDVTTRNNGIARSFFDFGDVIIETAGSQQKFEFNSVLHPREIASIILDLSDQAKRRIESGGIHLEPTGEFKAVINNAIYREVEPLVSMGVVVPKGKKASVEPSPKPTPVPTETQEDSDLDIVIDDPTATKPKA